jgi:hypothetical protein
MSEDTVASLGFAVDSKPLDDAKQKLKDLSTEAGNTGQARRASAECMPTSWRRFYPLL